MLLESNSPSSNVGEQQGASFNPEECAQHAQLVQEEWRKRAAKSVALLPKTPDFRQKHAKNIKKPIKNYVDLGKD